MEQWKDVPGYEGKYQASTLGNIKNIFARGNKRDRPLSKVVGNNGYYKVVLYKNGNRNTANVHRLIALTFIENLDNLPVVMHLDNNKLNCDVTNLKWGTIKDNNYQMIFEGRNNFTNGNHPDLGKLRGENKGAKKVNQYTKEGVFIKTWDCIKDGAESVNIKYNGIYKACKKGQNAGGFKWSYSV